MQESGRGICWRSSTVVSVCASADLTDTSSRHMACHVPMLVFSTNRGDRVARGLLERIAEVGIDQVTISRGRPTRALQRRPSLPTLVLRA
jgi:hypothetical protein